MSDILTSPNLKKTLATGLTGGFAFFKKRLVAAPHGQIAPMADSHWLENRLLSLAARWSFFTNSRQLLARNSFRPARGDQREKPNAHPHRQWSKP